LETDKSEILETLRRGIQKGKTQVEFGLAGKELSQQTKEEIESLELPGIQFMKESLRYYPNGMFASRIIGFAQKQGEEDEDGNEKNAGITGVTGMERQMDARLVGKDGYISYKRDKYGTKLLDPDEFMQ